MFYYAQINEKNICTGLAQSPVEMEESGYILISEPDFSIVGKQYVNGEWVEPKPPVVPNEIEIALMKTQATIYEELQENRLSQMKANADIYEAILSNGGNV